MTIGISDFTDDIMSAGGHADVTKTIKNCREVEETKKFTDGLKKKKYMVMQTGKEDTREITEEGQIGKTETHKYLGILMNEEGDLEDHLEQKAKLSTSVPAQIKITGSQHRVRAESIRVQLELYDKCAYPAISYGIHACCRLKKNEINELEKIQRTLLRRIFNLPQSIPYAGVLIETKMRPMENRINYATLMYYHSAMNSEKRLVKETVIQ